MSFNNNIQRSELLNVYRRIGLLILFSFILLGLHGCGGGGSSGGSSSDGGPVEPVIYSGNETPADVSEDNAEEIALAIIGGGDLAKTFTAASVGDSGVNLKTTNSAEINRLSLLLTLNQQIKKELRNSTVKQNEVKRVTAAAVTVDQTDSCDGGRGRLVQSGTLEDSGIGNLTFDFIKCNLDGVIYSGAIEFTIFDYDINNLIPLDMSTSITRLTIQESAYKVAVGGSFHSLIDLSSNMEVMTANMIFEDSITGESAKLENLTITLEYSDIYNTYSHYSMTMTGRFYDSVDGYVDVFMDSPWQYTSTDAEYPYAGGDLRVVGNNAVEVVVSPVNSTTAYVGVDGNGDGLYEHAVNMPWTNIGANSSSNNTAPTANAGQNLTATTPLIQLDGTRSSDPEYDLLSYEWSVVQSPAADGAVLSNASTNIPSIMITVPGAYEIELEVSDGQYTAVDTMTITAPKTVVAPIFSPYQAIDPGPTPQASAIGDLNGDGLNDVVLTTSSEKSNVYVFLQNGLGKLNLPVEYDAGINPSHYYIESVKVADMNNDGRDDVVISHERAIGVYLQNRLGTLDPVITYETSSNHYLNSTLLAIADFNNDGNMDVASSNGIETPAIVDIFLQGPTGTLNHPLPQSVTGHALIDMEVGDINNDGLTDIITVNPFDNHQLVIMAQQSDGAFSEVVGYGVSKTKGVNGVSIGDFNGDSLLDVVVTLGGNRPDSQIAVRYQDANGLLGTWTYLPSHDIPDAVEVGDFNGDGRTDIAVSHQSWHRLGIYLQQENGELSAEELYPIGNGFGNTQSLSVGDINNDGRDDAVIASFPGLVILYNQNQ